LVADGQRRIGANFLLLALLARWHAVGSLSWEARSRTPICTKEKNENTTIRT
jgi:hypothetical protein